MTPKDIFGVIARTIGLVLVLSGSYAIVSILALMLGTFPSDEGFTLRAILPNALAVWAGLWLLLRAPRVMGLAYPSVADGAEEESSTYVPDLAAGRAYLSAYHSEGRALPRRGRIYISVGRIHSLWAIPRVKHLLELGYEVTSTGQTFRALSDASISCTALRDLPSHPVDLLQALSNGEIQFIFRTDDFDLRIARQAEHLGIPVLTTRTAISGMINGLTALHEQAESGHDAE